jgi:hypothetical protein
VLSSGWVIDGVTGMLGEESTKKKPGQSKVSMRGKINANLES